MITKENLSELSVFHDSFCISIYMPTHRSGEKTLKGEDSIKLKNIVKEVRTKLELRGMHGDALKEFLKPLNDLISDSAFWRFQSEGLVLFLSKDLVRKFHLPVSFDEMNYVSSEFYLKPLLPLINDDGMFYLLTLKKDEVRLYEGHKWDVSEMDIEELIPSRIEERVGYDYEQKQLQFRTRYGRGSAGSFHGHGEGDTSEKNELLLFFQAIDRGVVSKLRDRQEHPLVLCCLDYYYPIYREANTYKNLFPQYISYNPADLDSGSLHQKARELLMPYYNQKKHLAKNKLAEGLSKGKASSDIKEIIQAAIQGRIESIFIDKNAEIYGIYDPSADEVQVQDTTDLPAVSLTNLAARKVFEHGGTVYLTDRQDLPDDSSVINALFRY